MIRNPYIAGNPVGNTDRFVGRGGIIAKLGSVIHDPMSPGAILWGQRRIGKTSLLQHFSAFISRAHNWRSVLIDMSECHAFSSGEVAQHIINRICADLSALDESFASVRSVSEMDWIEGFWRPKAQALGASVKLLLLLDEFDIVLSGPSRWYEHIIFFVRRLLDASPLALKCILVSGRHIDSVPSAARALLRNFQMLSVPSLTRSESDMLVSRSESNGSLHWTERSLTRVWYWAAGHPLLTQALCAQIWENVYFSESEPIDEDLQRSESIPIDDEAIDGAIGEVLIRYGHSLNWLWDGLTDFHRRVFLTLACSDCVMPLQELLLQCKRSAPPDESVAAVQMHLQHLIDWGLVSCNEHGLMIRPGIFRRWALRYGSAGVWHDHKVVSPDSSPAALQTLSDFLQDAFVSQELLDIVRALPEGRKLVNQISADDSIAQIVAEFLAVAQRYGILTAEEIWAELYKARPRRQRDIAVLEDAFRGRVQLHYG